ncbi:MAG TPA: ribosome small subunit-dependent GTPase A [Rectinemataceae bacterium]|nr:ribosome small subunit-dependent GTPase A [Rectinemataceae bacterium]
MQGLVLSGSNNVFLVYGDDGVRRLCSIKGKRLKDQKGLYNVLAAGDRVEFLADSAGSGRGLVSRLLPRRNLFGRFNEKGRAVQAIAANVDLVVCVSSPSLPPFRPRFVDRIAVLAEAASVPLLIVLNKADLGCPAEVAARLASYESLGYRALPVSAATGDALPELRRALAGKTSVFAGQSGVGKSSLLNALEPGIERRVGAVSEKYDRGKHTTTMAELFMLGDGETRIIDTPGVRRLALRGIDPKALDAYFPELAPLAPRCEYGLSCTHTDESGCRVVRAVMDGHILEDRFESYLRIREELLATAEYRPVEGRPRSPRSRGDGVRKTARTLRQRRGPESHEDDDD